MPADFLSVLKEDRNILQSLVDQVQSTQDFKLKQQLTNDLYLSLTAHMAAIETSALPLLRTFAGPSLPNSFAEAHDRLKGLLSDVMAHRLSAHGLNAALGRLCPALMLQNERERLFLLPAIERAMDMDERASLALESCGSLTRHMRKHVLSMPAPRAHAGLNA
ncbi:MAG: hypothetical protein EOP38_02300 [Rubrivivax sp.]|nr:MAG: hypothetical protein EOP38_02300 [Rubrivivax sp.]